MKNKKRISAAIMAGIITLLILWCIGPGDALSHGFYCEMTDYEQAAITEQYTGLDVQPFVQKFVPAGKHFRGFEIVLVNLPEENSGELIFDIADENGSLLEEIVTDVTQIQPGKPYQIYTSERLKKGQTYTLTIAARDCQTLPYLLLAQDCDLAEENLDGNLYIGYAYGKSTFSGSEKVLLCTGVFLFSILIIGSLLLTGKKRQLCHKICVFALMALLLTWNYVFNSFGRGNVNLSDSEIYRERTAFENFQIDSETYVTGVLAAEHEGVTLSPYGLGRYTNLCGELKKSNDFMIAPESFLPVDEDFEDGYSLSGPKLLVPANDFTEEACVPGNSILFANGTALSILECSVEEKGCVLTLLSAAPLSKAEYGSLADARIIGNEGSIYQNGRLEAYKSQYGLQGKIFRHIAGILPYESVVDVLHLLCSVFMAITWVGIVWLLRRKYDTLFAGCFYMVGLLSPWLTNFAGNLYWVEFTWFLPMLTGLVCSIWLKNLWVRLSGYAAAFITLFIKSLCGYEYISTIMMGLIVFLVVDLIMAGLGFVKGVCERAEVLLLLRTIFLLGLAAVAGFLAAVLLHAMLRGDGSLMEGILSIWKEDVMHRTIGGRLTDFDPEEWNSLQASVWNVWCTYFHFETPILTGLPGNLFPLMAVMPLMLLGYDAWNKKLDEKEITDMVLYGVCLLMSVSWFVLGKSHSQMHTHLNYVLWYFGFVQVCIYIIIRSCRKWLGKE